MRDGAAHKCQVRKKATAAAIKCSEHSALGFGSYAPLRHSWGPDGGAHSFPTCPVTVRGSYFRRGSSKSSWPSPFPSQFLDLTEDISAVHAGWGEAEGRKHVTSLREQMLHEKTILCARGTKQVGALPAVPVPK